MYNNLILIVYCFIEILVLLMYILDFLIKFFKLIKF